MAIETVIDDGVLIITNSDPATRNSISVEFYDAMAAAISYASSDQGVRAVVVTGAGDFFCSGGNINALAQRLDMDAAGRRQGIDRLHEMVRAMRACPKPIIAAVQGGAAGAGVALALACDLIVADQDAYFAVSYVRIGLTPDGGTTSYLAQALPRQLANELAMTGNRIGAERFHEFGLVNELTTSGTATNRALEWAKELAAGPAQSLAAIKSLVAAGQVSTFDDQLDAEAQFMTTALGGAEGREGIGAFLAKRKPDYSE